MIKLYTHTSIFLLISVVFINSFTIRNQQIIIPTLTTLNPSSIKSNNNHYNYAYQEQQQQEGRLSNEYNEITHPYFNIAASSVNRFKLLGLSSKKSNRMSNTKLSMSSTTATDQEEPKKKNIWNKVRKKN